MQGGLFSTLLKPCPHALRNLKHLAGPNLVGIVQLVLVRVEHLMYAFALPRCSLAMC
jgi:hypothetical protein